MHSIVNDVDPQFPCNPLGLLCTNILDAAFAFLGPWSPWIVTSMGCVRRLALYLESPVQYQRP
jgi:hypothetical protein